VATLHIEHLISDLETWLGAFNRFEDARQNAGVRSQHVHQPVDDDKYIFVTLDFDSVAEATAFKSFLESSRVLARVALAKTPALLEKRSCGHSLGSSSAPGRSTPIGIGRRAVRSACRSEKKAAAYSSCGRTSLAESEPLLRRELRVDGCDRVPERGGGAGVAS
jgi:hypothetical protein